MAKSVRIEPELEIKLDRAAKVQNVSHSEFIRDAVSRRCDEVLGETLADRLADVIGIIDSGGGRADQTGKAFRQLLAKKKRK